MPTTACSWNLTHLNAKRPFILFCIAGLILLIFATANAEFKKSKIAVLDFQLQGSGFETEDMGKIVAEWLITALVREGRFEVVERRLLEKIINEQKLIMAGVVDENSATQLGKLLGVKVIISGSVLKFADVIEVNARIIDVESASIIAAESVKSAVSTQLEDLVIKMANMIIRDFPLEGYIVHRQDANVVLDLGKRIGVKAGMHFFVFKEGNVIKHPKTGEILDVEKIRTGVVEITTVKEKISDAVIREETESGAIQYGQLVKSLADKAEPKTAAIRPPQALVSESVTARLWVDTAPTSARVRILNIGPPYHDGIELETGRYQVEVTAPGYSSQVFWVALTASEQKRMPVTLTPMRARAPEPKPATEPDLLDDDLEADDPDEPEEPPLAIAKPSAGKASPLIDQCLKLLKSPTAADKKKGARSVYRRFPQHDLLLEAVKTELLNGYRQQSQDRNHVDAMAWMCNVLGRSGKKHYLPVLKQVADGTANRKLKKYAQDAYNKLKG